MFESVDARTHAHTDARTPARVPSYKLTLWAFGSGELIKHVTSTLISFIRGASANLDTIIILLKIQTSYAIIQTYIYEILGSHFYFNSHEMFNSLLKMNTPATAEQVAC